MTNRTVVLDYLFSQDGSLPISTRFFLSAGARYMTPQGIPSLSVQVRGGEMLRRGGAWGTNPVVRLGRDVGDGADLEASGL